LADARQGQAAGTRAWIGLAVLGLPTILLALDLSVLYLALPRLSIDLRATATEQLWITDIYGFVTAGFLVTMGTLGDRIGRRKLLLIGAAGFGVASVLAAYSTSVATLIAARALMGLAGATLMPSTLALISNMFRDAAQRATAIAVWTACFMAGAAVGPVVGGALLEHFWWGSLFLLGVPVMVLLLITGPLLLPEYKSSLAGRPDIASVALSLAAILPVIYAIKTLATNGVTGAVLVTAAIGVGAGVAFLIRQRRLASPLLDLRLFLSPPFTASLVILMCALAAQSGITLLVSEYLQVVDGLSPLRAGKALVPASVVMIVACLVAPLVVRFVRPGRIIGAGLLVSTAGYLLLARVDGVRDLRTLMIAAVLIFAGIGPMAVFSQDLVIGSVPHGQAGSAAALSEASGDLGIALGVALFGSVSTAVYTRQLVALLPTASGNLVELARHARTAGLHAATLSGAGVTLALAVVAFTVLSGLPSAAVMARR
jgi:MFS transporter, DHA2 family, multidrug resistance protein